MLDLLEVAGSVNGRSSARFSAQRGGNTRILTGYADATAGESIFIRAAFSSKASPPSASHVATPTALANHLCAILKFNGTVSLVVGKPPTTLRLQSHPVYPARKQLSLAIAHALQRILASLHGQKRFILRRVIVGISPFEVALLTMQLRSGADRL